MLRVSNAHISLTKHDVPPFEIFPPPPQPAASQREGTGFIHPNLPQLPFTLAIIGPRNCGKSTVIRNVLDTRNYGSYGAAFKRSNVIFYSPTMEFDKTITSLGLKNVYGPTTPPKALIANIKEQQETFRAQEDMADVLVTFEDCTNTKDAWTVLTDLGYTGRHFGIHSIAVAHKLTSIPRGNRTQLQQWFIFKPHEESEREWILYMFSRLPTRKIWQKALARAWSQEYNFVYIDFERKGMAEIYRSGMNDSLFTPQEMQMILDIENGIFIPKRPTDSIPSGARFPPGRFEDTDNDISDTEGQEAGHPSAQPNNTKSRYTKASRSRGRGRGRGRARYRGQPGERTYN